MNKSYIISAITLASILSLSLTSTTAFAQASDEGGVAQQVQEGPVMVAGPVPIDGTWTEFSNEPPDPSVSTGCNPADPAGLNCIPSSAGNSMFGDAPPWTFTCPASGCWLTVTDAFNLGDQYEVFDNAASIGSTPPVPLPAQSGEQCAGAIGLASDPELCVLDPNSSTGMFNLGSGAHSITITRIASDPSVQFTAAYFKIVIHQAVGGDFVPLDTTMVLAAGAQYTAAGMIPVIVSAIGIGIVIARKF